MLLNKKKFFTSLQQRFIRVYNENPHDDFVQRITDPRFYNDKDNLNLIYETLYYVHKENENEDFMQKLKKHIEDVTWKGFLLKLEK